MFVCLSFDSFVLIFWPQLPELCRCHLSLSSRLQTTNGLRKTFQSSCVYPLNSYQINSLDWLVKPLLLLRPSNERLETPESNRLLNGLQRLATVRVYRILSQGKVQVSRRGTNHLFASVWVSKVASSGPVKPGKADDGTHLRAAHLQSVSQDEARNWFFRKQTEGESKANWRWPGGTRSTT